MLVRAFIAIFLASVTYLSALLGVILANLNNIAMRSCANPFSCFMSVRD